MNKKYRYSHMGIPAAEKMANAKYLSDFDVYISDFAEDEFNIEYLYFGENATLPKILQQMPHIAFEVDDIEEAIEGHEVIMPPNDPKDKIRVAFVLSNGVPVEFLQY